MAGNVKAASYAAKVKAERAKIAALESKISKLQQQEIEKIGKLAESSGCLDVVISDAEYKAAFDALVKSKTSGNSQASNGTNKDLSELV